jgi:transposase
MTDLDRGTDRRGRRAKRMLTPLQKYEVWLQLIRQEVTVAGAAIAWQVDPSTITRIKAVAKEGALAALSESKPGARARERDWELEALRADNARLAEAVKQMAVKLTLIEGKEGWG